MGAVEQQKIDFAIGGQALIEGVMVRSPNFISIAVRKPNGTIATKKDPFRSLAKKIRILKLPLLRGILNLFEMIVIGMRAVNFSAQEAFEDEEKNEEKKDESEKTALQKFFEGLSFAISIMLSIAFALFLFKFIPLWLTTQLEKLWPALKQSYFAFNIIDGVIRISLFLLYIAFLGIFKYFRRVFEYHGAEHQAIFAYEKNLELNGENVGKQSPCHPRCGTNFLIIVFVIAVFLFTLAPRHPNFWINFGIRLIIIPAIAGAGYEFLKWAAKRQNHWLVRAVTIPGLLTQKLTTRKPDEKQVEVAICAVLGALELEKNPDVL